MQLLKAAFFEKIVDQWSCGELRFDQHFTIDDLDHAMTNCMVKSHPKRT